MNPTAVLLYDAEITFQNAVATGYDVDPESVEVYTRVMPLCGETAFEVVTKAEGEDVGAVIAGRGDTFEAAVQELFENARKALSEAKDPALRTLRQPKAQPAPARRSGHLKLVHSA